MNDMVVNSDTFVLDLNSHTELFQGCDGGTNPAMFVVYEVPTKGTSSSNRRKGSVHLFTYIRT